MPTIQLIDNFGDYWDITIRTWVIVNEECLCETWHYVVEGPMKEQYPMVPLPLFVEWWV